MIRAKFDTAADWVNSRIPPVLAHPTLTSEIEHAFAMLNTLILKAKATFLIPDLFPGVALEVLYIHYAIDRSIDMGINDTLSALREEGQLAPVALTAIGTAIAKEMQTSATDTVRYPVNDESLVIVFLPEVRSVVLQATGTTLLPD